MVMIYSPGLRRPLEFGLHTREVLVEEGMEEAEVEDLIVRGIVGQAEPKSKMYPRNEI